MTEPELTALQLEDKKAALAKAEDQMTGLTVSVYNGMMQLQEGLLAAYCAETHLSPTEVLFKMKRTPGKHGEGWLIFCVKNTALGI